MYKSEMILDSINSSGCRLSTMKITMPRIILSEFNTHRVLSRNSASSRAIPFPKMLRSVMENPFIPLKWMKDHPGMQGTEFYSNDEQFAFIDVQGYLFNRFKLKQDDEDFIPVLEVLKRISSRSEFMGAKTLTQWWLTIRDLVVECASLIFCFNVSKQICNRLLEPFMWHTVLVSATEWQNYFALRAHGAAEMHMQHIAELMLNCYNYSDPKELAKYEWHIPYTEHISEDAILEYLQDTEIHPRDIRLQVSTMMCARTSYTVPGDEMSEWTIKKYVEKAEGMSTNGHWSPFEHCGQNMDNTHQYGNFRGWRQYRKTFANENRRDSRVKLK